MDNLSTVSEILQYLNEKEKFLPSLLKGKYLYTALRKYYIEAIDEKLLYSNRYSREYIIIYFRYTVLWAYFTLDELLMSSNPVEDSPEIRDIRTNFKLVRYYADMYKPNSIFSAQALLANLYYQSLLGKDEFSFTEKQADNMSEALKELVLKGVQLMKENESIDHLLGDFNYKLEMKGIPIPHTPEQSSEEASVQDNSNSTHNDSNQQHHHGGLSTIFELSENSRSNSHGTSRMSLPNCDSLLSVSHTSKHRQWNIEQFLPTSTPIQAQSDKSFHSSTKQTQSTLNCEIINSSLSPFLIRNSNSENSVIPYTSNQSSSKENSDVSCIRCESLNSTSSNRRDSQNIQCNTVPLSACSYSTNTSAKQLDCSSNAELKENCVSLTSECEEEKINNKDMNCSSSVKNFQSKMSCSDIEDKENQLEQQHSRLSFSSSTTQYNSNIENVRCLPSNSILTTTYGYLNSSQNRIQPIKNNNDSSNSSHSFSDTDVQPGRVGDSSKRPSSLFGGHKLKDSILVYKDRTKNVGLTSNTVSVTDPFKKPYDFPTKWNAFFNCPLDSSKEVINSRRHTFPNRVPDTSTSEINSLSRSKTDFSYREVNHSSSTLTNTPKESKPEPVEKFSINRRSTDPETIVIGETFYCVNMLIGKGGSSKVYSAFDSSISRNVAVKCIDLEDRQQYIESFNNEINILKRLNNTNYVVQLLNYEVQNEISRIFIVLELADLTLEKVLNFYRRENLLNDRNILSIWKQMLKCVEYLHNSDVIHLDLKPTNFVYHNGVIKLIDLGICKEIMSDRTHLTDNKCMGTFLYMSPERLSCVDKIKVSRKSDVWSLGIILYAMVYDSHPFGHLATLVAQVIALAGDDPIRIPDTGSTIIDQSLRRSLVRSVCERATVSELLTIL